MRTQSGDDIVKGSLKSAFRQGDVPVISKPATIIGTKHKDDGPLARVERT
jgi:hypothetical protein